MALNGLEGQGRGTGLSHRSDDPAVTSGGHVASGAGVALLDIARGEDLLVLDDHPPDRVSSVFVRPNPGDDIIHRVDNVAIAVVAHGAMGSLRGVANYRNGRVDEKVQPIACLLHERASFQPDRSAIQAAL